MRVEEIALRKEIRQMLNESGINRETLREMAQKVMEEEVKKQVKNAFSQNDIKSMVSANRYEIRDAFTKVVQEQIRSTIKISVNVENGVL